MRQRNLQARTCSKPSDGQQIPTVNAKIASLRLAAHRKERAVRIDAALTSVLFLAAACKSVCVRRVRLIDIVMSTRAS
jgi:hypothetical protein